MTYTEVLDYAKGFADPRAVKVWNRIGDNRDGYLGVGLTKLKSIAKEIKRDHERALQLWDSGVHEGKLLATLTDEPKKVTQDQLELQVKDIKTFDLANWFVKNLVEKTPFLFFLANSWSAMDQPEMVRRTGYSCVCSLAKNSRTLDNNYFEKHLTLIEIQLVTAPNWVKEGQNYALIAIGSRNKVLNAKALKIADAVGEVTVDYGDTSCKTSDARAILRSDRVQGKL